MSAVVVSAQDINREHALARSLAETAIQHAVRCGDLLTAKKAELPHGSFQAWIAANCEFEYSTASRYMKAARQISTGVEISKLSDVFLSGQLQEEESEPEPPAPDWQQMLASVEPFPMASGKFTVGFRSLGGDFEDEPIIMLYESRKWPGYWYDIDFRHSTVAVRPARPDLLCYLFRSDVGLRGLSWELTPDDGGRFPEYSVEDIIGASA